MSGSHIAFRTLINFDQCQCYFRRCEKSCFNTNRAAEYTNVGSHSSGTGPHLGLHRPISSASDYSFLIRFDEWIAHCASHFDQCQCHLSWFSTSFLVVLLGGRHIADAIVTNVGIIKELFHHCFFSMSNHVIIVICLSSKFLQAYQLHA